MFAFAVYGGPDWSGGRFRFAVIRYVVADVE